MYNELYLYKTWRKLCKKINKNEDEILKEICHEDKNIMNIIKSLSFKIKMRQITKRLYDRRNI